MKTRMVVLLTALASFALFTLFAYCSKDETIITKGGSNSTNDVISYDLAGTTWKTSIPWREREDPYLINVYFNNENTGRFTKDDKISSFSYSLNGVHGAIFCSNNVINNGTFEFIPNNATILIIDSTTIGIGGRVFTRQ